MVHKTKSREKYLSDVEWEKIEEMYDYEIPQYLKIVNKNKIQIKASPWEGAKVSWITITPKDVINYYKPTNPMGASGMSGARTLAGFSTDWRMVDNMAKESLEIFKVINKEALQKEGKKFGMELRE